MSNLSTEERSIVQEAMRIALQEAASLVRTGTAIPTAEVRAKPILRAVLDASGLFTPADINKMVDTFKMKVDESNDSP